MKTIIAIVALFSSLALAGVPRDQDKELGSEVQNGGGGICFPDGRCVTLAEAGLRIVRAKDPYFQPPSELVKEVRRVVDILPLSKVIKTQLLKEIFGIYSTFTKVEEADPKRFLETERSYTNLLKEVGSSIKAGDFKLFAASDALSVPSYSITKAELKYRKINKAKTYLLPKFFNAGLRTQALTLVHEGLVRGMPPSILPTVLDFDGAFLSLIERNGQLNQEDFGLLVVMDELDFYMLESETLVVNVPSIMETRFRHFAYTTEKVLNRPLQVEEVFGSMENGIVLKRQYVNTDGRELGPQYYQLDSSRDSLLILQDINPIFPKLLGRFSVVIRYLYNADRSKPGMLYPNYCGDRPRNDKWWIVVNDLEVSSTDKNIYFLKCHKNIDSVVEVSAVHAL